MKINYYLLTILFFLVISEVSIFESDIKNYYTETGISRLDTNLNESDYIKYEIENSNIIIRISMNNITKLIRMKYDCNMPDVLIPKIYSYNNSNNNYYILLKRGYSNSYREIMVCELVSDSIEINSFEIEHTENAFLDIFVYQFVNFENRVFYSNIAKSNCINDCLFSIKLPFKYKNLKIIKSIVKENSIVLIFNDNSKYEWILE